MSFAAVRLCCQAAAADLQGQEIITQEVLAVLKKGVTFKVSLHFVSHNRSSKWLY
jgi:hypothetical protein